MGRTCEGVADIALGGRGMQAGKGGVEGGAREHNKAAKSCTRLAFCPSDFRLGKAGKACLRRASVVIGDRRRLSAVGETKR